MTTILTDSMARDHADTMLATAAASRRARESRQLRRAERRAERQHRTTTGRRGVHPLATVRSWLVAGQL